jgi:biotin carboxylase
MLGEDIMRTAIILSTRGFQSFRFDLLKERRSVRFVGIFSEQDVNNLSADHRRHFDEIHTVRCGIPDDPSRLDSSTVDLEATREVVRGVLAGAEPGTVTVHSYDEWNVLVAAQLRTELDIPGPSYEDILPFRDKCLMKERLIEHGVRVPRFGRFEPEAQRRDAAACFGQIAARVGVPFILKPIDSAGSDGVHKITSWDEFKALGAFRRGYEYEEFITGTIYSVNIVSRARKSLFAEVTEYLVNSLDVQSGKVNADINLHHTDPRRARFVAFAETALWAGRTALSTSSCS